MSLNLRDVQDYLEWCHLIYFHRGIRIAIKINFQWANEEDHLKIKTKIEIR